MFFFVFDFSQNVTLAILFSYSGACTALEFILRIELKGSRAGNEVRGLNVQHLQPPDNPTSAQGEATFHMFIAFLQRL